jgi:pyruvate formate lyase activating enzyme
MRKGLISKIQRYSTKDGPGIRSTVLFVGCNLRCIWCANPELIKNETQILYYREYCAHCGACAALSNGTITVGKEGCEIDRERCTNLAECAVACYHGAYETSGQAVAPPELTRKLIRDKVFYEESGGGITFSGGEPALHSDFIAETAALLKKENLHIALDTAGNVEWEVLKTAAEKADLVLYDIKAFDEEVHRRCTGCSNSLILENAERLARWNKTLCVRLILAPPYNEAKDFEERPDFAASLGKTVIRIDILPLHKLGAGKYRALGIPDPMEGLPECPDEVVLRAAAFAEHRGFTVAIGG